MVTPNLKKALEKAEKELQIAEEAYEAALKNLASGNLNALKAAREKAYDAWCEAYERLHQPGSSNH
jgi:hypothetical protein